MKIHTLTISHRHGQDVTAHASYAEAHETLADFVREWWTHEGLAGEPPTDDTEAITYYFERMDDESADIDECDLALPTPIPDDPRAYTVILRYPDSSVFDDDRNTHGGTYMAHVEAESPEAAFGVAQDEAVASCGERPEDWAVVSVFAGHLQDLVHPMSDKQRIIDLQKQLRIARTALEKIGHGHSRDPEADALSALDDMRPRDKTVPLDGILGWERRPR